MGGRPLTALALCMFPKALEAEVAREILAGGQDKVLEAGAVVAGGHTVRGEELFYGLSVTGVVDPRRITRNVGARPGDALVLTKPLGSGLIINGMRKGPSARPRRGRRWTCWRGSTASPARRRRRCCRACTR